jgi:clan AA aspartic protease
VIHGTINENLEPIIQIRLFGNDGSAEEVVGAIDTGFSDYLTLPPTLIDDLELPFESSVEMTLADGQIVELSCYRAQINWDGVVRNIIVAASECDPLIGMSLLEGFDLRMRVRPGGDVIIERIT